MMLKDEAALTRAPQVAIDEEEVLRRNFPEDFMDSKPDHLEVSNDMFDDYR